MISIDRSASGREPIQIKIVGIGGAGSNALDRLVLDGVSAADLVSANTDVQSLSASVAADKLQLGRNVTRGLGAGGDPELGYAAAEEAADEIRQSLTGAGTVFLCAGLGGGTGSGGAPLVASLAKEAGALVIAFVTMPFSFEGKRRRQQAEEALNSLRQSADAVICFENDKMGEAVSPKAGIHQAFAAADQTLSHALQAVASVLNRSGLLRIGFDDLAAALRAGNGDCIFGFGEAEGDNRCHDALARALKNPLMDKGRLLSDAATLLVNIAGGPSLTLSEVQILMEELNRFVAEETQILFGVTVDPKLGNRMSVTLISSIGHGHVAVTRPAPARPARKVQPAPVREPEPLPVEPEVEPEAESVVEAEPAVASEAVVGYVEAEQYSFIDEQSQQPWAPEPDEPAEPDESEPEPVAVVEPQPKVQPKPRTAPKPVPAPEPAAPKIPQQETLQFEPVTRGRFEKSEPTIVDGQDLDVPTFLRRNVRLK